MSESCDIQNLEMSSVMLPLTPIPPQWLLNAREALFREAGILNPRPRAARSILAPTCPLCYLEWGLLWPSTDRSR